jgi:hypothetical protein
VPSVRPATGILSTTTALTALSRQPENASSAIARTTATIFLLRKPGRAIISLLRPESTTEHVVDAIAQRPGVAWLSPDSCIKLPVIDGLKSLAHGARENREFPTSHRDHHLGVSDLFVANLWYVWM